MSRRVRADGPDVRCCVGAVPERPLGAADSANDLAGPQDVVSDHAA